jgi:hypothetical protein
MTTPDGIVCGPDDTPVPDHEAHRKGKPPRPQRLRLKGRMKLAPTAIPGIDLRDYGHNPKSRGWGDPCTQARTTVTLSNGVRFTVASRIARLATLVLNECIRRGYKVRQADTGGYNCRFIAGTTTWSMHAWALAIDVNWNTNPFTSSRVTDKPDWLFALFNRYGFANGADYSGRRDWMHHEFMGTPTQADTATALAEKELGDGKPPTPLGVVEATQQAVNLPVDGIWGNFTERGITNVRAATTANQFPDGVAETQARVGTTPDGKWGPASAAALVQTVKELQAAWGGNPDGKWGPDTEARFQANRTKYYKP